MANILLIPVLLALGTGWLYLLASNAPAVSTEHFTETRPAWSDTEDENFTELLSDTNATTRELVIKFPGSLDELKALAALLHKYNDDHSVYVLLLFVSAYIYKQTFAIPGSIFLNLLGGALFGLTKGFILVCILAATGASCCYLLSSFCGCKYVVKYFPEKVALLQGKVEENRHRLLYYLLFIRLFPMTPNWFINIVSPVLNIPLHLFFISVLIGLMPYNFICIQTGVILAEITSLDDMFTLATFIKLLLVALVALLPSFFIRRLGKKGARLGAPSEGGAPIQAISGEQESSCCSESQQNDKVKTS